MPGTPRDRARAQTMSDIVRIGRHHLATDGAAALSLRAVARDLGVVSSAVYRYVKSRDDLLTLLVVDGYDELGDAVDAAVAAVPADDFPGRQAAIGRAVRTWGLAEPATYALLFGSPVPGYEAPAEQTMGPGTRVVRALVTLWAEAYAAGRMSPPTVEVTSPALAAGFSAAREELDLPLPDGVIAAGVFGWAALFGCVSFEIFGQYGDDALGDPAALFEHHLELLAAVLGLR
ncbi:TetR-like C-terminal domain-containing protein [Nocardioides sp. CER19]|uniref:TetR/AcrR family transcriptional regulator n=1 Tax=Nocardioides sp. CER19 TaxID=3038538 RepID=UPI002448F571|nr:TetR-like C-terminal domain-containing protein [Nocardioides sp. CER19]MDH2413721.1 TetR-like C-terminal domain-containing protein [Nocardioides sp. CER19]